MKLIVYFYLYLEEEIISFFVLVDLVKKDVDERIFKGFGFIYGVVVCFKYEFLKFFFMDLVDKFLVISFCLKLIMGVMFGFDFDMKRMYLFKYVISIF